MAGAQGRAALAPAHGSCRCGAQGGDAGGTGADGAVVPEDRKIIRAGSYDRGLGVSKVNWFPLVSFDLIEDSEADALLVQWDHWLGGCNRPFGRQSFGLKMGERIVSVAVSASTVNASCGGYQVVELARLCSDPSERWASRVCLRLWRETAAKCWQEQYGRKSEYWDVIALVSYSNAIRHKGDLYRFDGWTKVADVPGGVAGTTWKRPRKNTFDPKAVWIWKLSRGREHATVMWACRK